MIKGIQSSGSERFSAALFDASLLTPEPPPGGSFFAISPLHGVAVRRKRSQFRQPGLAWVVRSWAQVSRKETRCREWQRRRFREPALQIGDDLLTPFCQGVGLARVKSL